MSSNGPIVSETVDPVKTKNNFKGGANIEINDKCLNELLYNKKL